MSDQGLRRGGVVAALCLISMLACGGDLYSEATAGRSQVVGAEYFGVHFHRLVLRPGEKAARTVWPTLPFGSVRFWDSTTRWADIAPKPGVWEFERLDTYVSNANIHKASALYVLGSTPRWVSKRPDERCPYGFGCAAEPVRMAHWEEYVRRVALRYGKSIDAFELWNEPSFSDFPQDRAEAVSFFSGHSADMLELARLARKALDETNPRARLATPGFKGGGQRHLERFLESGGGKYVQIIAYHFYSANAEEFARKILDVRAIMRRHGAEHLPLWNTESGFESWSEGESLPQGVKERLSNKGVGARSAQLLVLGAAAGLERFFYFAWDNDRSGMINRSGEHLRSYSAMEQVQKWLIGARMKGCASVSKDAVSCLGEINGQVFLVAWSDRPGEKIVAIPKGYEVANLAMLYPDDPAPLYRIHDDKMRVSLGVAPTRILFRQKNPSQEHK